MGLFDSKKITNTSTTFNEETRQVNQQVRDGLGIGVEGSSNVVQLVDGGAIQRTADVAQALIKNNEAIAGGAFGFGGDAVSRALSFAGSSLNTSAGLAERALSAGTSAVNAAVSAAKPADSETLKTLAMYGALAFVALVIFMGVKK